MQSTHWGADDSVDELLYDSKSVDDWGVNRDMQGAYRQGSHLSAQRMPGSHFVQHARRPCVKSGRHIAEQRWMRLVLGAVTMRFMCAGRRWTRRSMPARLRRQACWPSGPHTRSELSTKLTDKGYDKACIERSISRLQELASLYPHFLYSVFCLFIFHVCCAPLRPAVPCLLDIQCSRLVVM